jgi:hypothetical protein
MFSYRSLRIIVGPWANDYSHFTNKETLAQRGLGGKKKRERKDGKREKWE